MVATATLRKAVVRILFGQPLQTIGLSDIKRQLAEMGVDYSYSDVEIVDTVADISQEYVVIYDKDIYDDL
jgi:hypothetical protein